MICINKHTFSIYYSDIHKGLQSIKHIIKRQFPKKRYSEYSKKVILVDKT